MQLLMLLKDGKKRKEKLQKINTVLLESLQGINLGVRKICLIFCEKNIL